MNDVLAIGASIAGGIGALIFLYLLVKNPQPVLAVLQSSGGFVMGESKILQGR